VITVILFGVEYVMTIEAYQWFVAGIFGLWALVALGIAWVVNSGDGDYCAAPEHQESDKCTLQQIGG
jgi:hypothetical protein